MQKPVPKEYNCPQSPLSKMKVHTSSSFSNGNNVNSYINISNNKVFWILESTEIQTNLGFNLEVNVERKLLEIPVQERLLPIGTTINLVQKINKNFGLRDVDSTSQSSSLNREDSSDKDQVYTCFIKNKISNILYFNF